VAFTPPEFEFDAAFELFEGGGVGFPLHATVASAANNTTASLVRVSIIVWPSWCDFSPQTARPRSWAVLYCARRGRRKPYDERDPIVDTIGSER
jgi:hypothetical protein